MLFLMLSVSVCEGEEGVDSLLDVSHVVTGIEFLTSTAGSRVEGDCADGGAGCLVSE